MVVRFDVPNTIHNVFEDFFTTDFFPTSSSFPNIDVAEDENQSVVVAELPGVKKEEVKITFENNVLTISGERKPYEIPEHARVLLNEMRVRDFSRSVTFEHDVDAERISAILENGVLTVALPKAETARARVIEVK